MVDELLGDGVDEGENLELLELAHGGVGVQAEDVGLSRGMGVVLVWSAGLERGEGVAEVELAT